MLGVAQFLGLHSSIGRDRSTLRHTGDVKDEILKKMLADTAIKGKAETFGVTISDVKAKPSTRWLTTYNRRRLGHI